jgi:hypothetical protein
MGVLGRVGERLGDDVVARHLDRLGEPRPDVHLQLDREDRAAGECLERRPEAAFGQDGRVDAARQLAQLLKGAGQAVGDPGQLRPELGPLGRHGRLGGAEVQHQRDQPLLGAVVQVALDPPACLVTGGHDPCPRGGQLLAALLQGAGHGVEAALKDPDLPDAALGRAHREVAGREPVGHGRRPADRLHDGPGQVAGEQGDEQGRPAQADPGGDDGPLGGRVRVSFVGRRQATLGRQEAVELAPDGVHALPALVGRGHRPRRLRVAPYRGHQRDRVVPQVGPDGLDDAPGLPLALRVVPDQPGQGGGLLGDGELGAPPRL